MRSAPSHPSRHRTLAFRFAEGVIRTPITVLTRRDWRGMEHLPQTAGFVAAANHISHVDPFTFAHFLLDNGCPPRFLAKEGLFDAPVIGPVITRAGQIPVLRESADAARSLGPAMDAARAGECVAIYPEGTLTRDPDGWPMVGKTGAARVALTTGCPVIPIAQWGAQELLPPYSKRLRVTRRTVSHVWAGPPVDLSAFALADPTRPPDGATLRAATEQIMVAITALLEQIRGERAPARRWDPHEHRELPSTGDPNRRPDGR